MKKMTLVLKGENYWGNFVYEHDGRLYADTNPNGIFPHLYTLSGNAFDGEPEMSVGEDIEIIFNPEREVIDPEKTFRYSMLGRLQSDCDYYLGNGNRHPRHLFYGNEKEHIEKMKELWNNFSEEDKPVWLTWKELLEYEKKMVKTECAEE